MIKEGSRVKILGLSRESAHYDERAEYVGKEAIITSEITEGERSPGGLFNCWVEFIANRHTRAFYKVKLKEIK